MSVKHLQCPTAHLDINVYSRSHFFTIELINKFESLHTSNLRSQSVFLSVSQLKCRNFNLYHPLLLLLSSDISLIVEWNSVIFLQHWLTSWNFQKHLFMLYVLQNLPEAKKYTGKVYFKDQIENNKKWVKSNKIVSICQWLLYYHKNFLRCGSNFILYLIWYIKGTYSL